MTEQAGPAPSVALLGTGIMGSGMARNMLRAGLALRVWNRTGAKATILGGDGAVVAATPADAVRGAGIIVTMLADADAVLDAMTAAGDGLAPGQIWAQASTVGLAGLVPLAELARERGLIFIDSPVQGTRQPAEAGQLLVYAAGPDGLDDSHHEVERVRALAQPVFDAIGRNTVWLPDVGDATRLKLVANSWVIALTNAAGETIALAQRLGVDPQLFLDAIAGGTLDSLYLRAKAAAILGEDYTPSFALTLAAKDTGLILDAASNAGVRMDLAEAAAERFRRAAGQGHGDKDMAAAYYASFE
jgi:3-hydroxyisobutyrate dehydrogenase